MNTRWIFGHIVVDGLMTIFFKLLFSINTKYAANQWKRIAFGTTQKWSSFKTTLENYHYPNVIVFSRFLGFFSCHNECLIVNKYSRVLVLFLNIKNVLSYFWFWMYIYQEVGKWLLYCNTGTLTSGRQG